MASRAISALACRPASCAKASRRGARCLATLKDALTEHPRRVEHLTVIDFHTGLGAFGAGEMITEDLPGSAGYARARAMWGDRVASSEAGESVSAPLAGTIDKAF